MIRFVTERMSTYIVLGTDGRTFDIVLLENGQSIVDLVLIQILSKSVPRTVGQTIVPIFHPFGFDIVLNSNFHLIPDLVAYNFVFANNLTSVIHHSSVGFLERGSYSCNGMRRTEIGPIVPRGDYDIALAIWFENRQDIVYSANGQDYQMESVPAQEGTQHGIFGWRKVAFPMSRCQPRAPDPHERKPPCEATRRAKTDAGPARRHAFSRLDRGGDGPQLRIRSITRN